MSEVAISVEERRQIRRAERRFKSKRYALLYVFCVVPVAALFIFHYIPIYGIIIAFKDFRPGLGIAASPWNNFLHFKDIFANPYFGRVFRNTVIISVLRLAFAFPAPIILAILLNEIQNLPFKKAVQSISYLPHFMSWVVIATLVTEILSPTRGIVGVMASWFNLKEVPYIMVDSDYFRAMLVVTHIWKAVGWGTIVYLAAISSIDPTLFDVADMDGVGRFAKAWHITIPSIIPVIIVLFILSVGRLLNAGFDQIFNLYNPMVYNVADIIDTYVYREGLLGGRFGYGAAVGVFKNIIGMTLVIGTNAIVRRFSEYGIW